MRDEGNVLTLIQMRIILSYFCCNYWVLIIYNSDPIPDTFIQVTRAMVPFKLSVKDCLIHFNDSSCAQDINIPVSKHSTDSLINKPALLHNNNSYTR